MPRLKPIGGYRGPMGKVARQEAPQSLDEVTSAADLLHALYGAMSRVPEGLTIAEMPGGPGQGGPGHRPARDPNFYHGWEFPKYYNTRRGGRSFRVETERPPLGDMQFSLAKRLEQPIPSLYMKQHLEQMGESFGRSGGYVPSTRSPHPSSLPRTGVSRPGPVMDIDHFPGETNVNLDKTFDYSGWRNAMRELINALIFGRVDK